MKSVLRWLAACLPPIVLAAVTLLSFEAYVRYSIFGLRALLHPTDYMSPTFRPVDCFAAGPEGELFTPECRMRYKGATVETNRLGLHDDEVDEERPHFRVLMIGDSVTMSAGVERDEAYHVVLERRLNRELGNDGFVEFYNHGRGGRTLPLQVLDMEKGLRRWSVDAALVALTPGNLWSMLTSGRTCQAGDPVITREERQFYDLKVSGHNLIATAFGFSEGRTGLWAFGKPVDLLRSWAVRLRAEPGDQETYLALERKGVALFRSCAQRMRRLADEGGVDLTWALLWYEPRREGSLIVAELESLGERAYVATNVYKSFSDPVDMVIYPGDPHPNAEVHEIYAERLHNWLDEIGWIEGMRRAVKERL